MRPYQLIRARRKTLALHITPDAALEVRAPLRLAQRDIDRFVAEKEAWIARHLRRAEARRQARREFAPRYGDTVPFLGRFCQIAAAPGGSICLAEDRFMIPQNLDAEEIKRAVAALYRALAKEILPRKAERFGRSMGVVPTGVRVNGAKSRWGSCSGANSLNFSWRLMMAAEDVVDYVVVHELAHIREHNHGARFWAVVERELPDYRERKKELRKLQERLAGEDWE